MLKIYFESLKLALLTQMQYKSSLVLMIIAQLLVAFCDFFAISALFIKFGSISNWSLKESALCYALITLCFSVGSMFAKGFEHFPALIFSGNFDRMLTVPLPTWLQVMANHFRLDRLGRIVLSALVMVWSFSEGGINWTLWKMILFCSSIVNGVLLFVSLFMLEATFCFWKIQPLEIINILTHGGVEVTQYPICIYNKIFKFIFTCIIPLAIINYYPLLFILEKNKSSSVFDSILAYASYLMGPIFFFIALKIWSIGEKKYTSAGG